MYMIKAKSEKYIVRKAINSPYTTERGHRFTTLSWMPCTCCCFLCQIYIWMFCHQTVLYMCCRFIFQDFILHFLCLLPWWELLFLSMALQLWTDTRQRKWYIYSLYFQRKSEYCFHTVRIHSSTFRESGWPRLSIHRACYSKLMVFFSSFLDIIDHSA